MVISETVINDIIRESIDKLLLEKKKTTNIYPNRLYHKSPISCRKSILKKGLLPLVGDSYKTHWENENNDNLVPYIFLYDHNAIPNGEYDSTYDDDIYMIDVSQLDKEHLSKDIDSSMIGCYVYDIPIPRQAISLIYKGSNKDSDESLMSRHSFIYESIGNGISFNDNSDKYGNNSITAFYNNISVGYLNYYVCSVDDICSNIMESIEDDGEYIAYEISRKLDSRKQVIDLADIDVKKEYRNMGVSKKLLEHILEKYNTYQFYLRVCPTDGVDENTLANSVMRYGFMKVGESDDGGTFLIKRP